MNVSKPQTTLEHPDVPGRTPEFPALGNLPYLAVLDWLHKNRRPEWYLEIGTASGNSLHCANCKSIAVDPHFKILQPVVSAKQALHLFQTTSDDFFASNVASKLGAVIDLAFLDGMHLFEFLLRDVIGTEKLCSTDGLIVLHDCCPRNFAMTNRVWDPSVTKAWTGDVWKVVPTLRKYRPDLTINVLDCPPTGLVLLSGLDPDNRVLEQNYDAIIAEFIDVELNEKNLPDLVSSLQVESANGYTGLKTPPASWKSAAAKGRTQPKKSRLRLLEERLYKFLG